MLQLVRSKQEFVHCGYLTGYLNSKKNSWHLQVSEAVKHCTSEFQLLSSFRCQLNSTFMPLFSWSKKRKKMSNYTPSIPIHIKIKIYNAYKITTKPLKIKTPNIPCALSLPLSRMGDLCLGNLREKLQISQISRMVNSREIPKSRCPKILKFPTSGDALFRNSSVRYNIKIFHWRKF